MVNNKEDCLTIKESMVLWSKRLNDYERANMPKQAIKACELKLEMLTAYYKAKENLEKEWQRKKKEGFRLLKPDELVYNNHSN